MWRLKLCVVRATKKVKVRCTNTNRQLYRLEDYVKAADLYKDLAGTQAAIENEENDLRINSGATDAQLEWKGPGNLVLKKKPGREDLEAFETAYNAACGSIARGELGQGEILLKRARGDCFLYNVISHGSHCAGRSV